MISRSVSIVAALLVLACAVWAFAVPAWPHDAPSGWSYPLECCSGYDCRPVSSAWVTAGADGYELPTGEVVPYSDARIKPSPDGEFHWCSVAGADDGKTICLFVPAMAF